MKMYQMMQYRQIKLLVALFGALCLLGGCATQAATSPTATPAPQTVVPQQLIVETPSPPVVNTSQASELQPVLDQVAGLLNNTQAPNDAVIAALIDPASPILRRVVREYIDSIKSTTAYASEPFGFQVLSVQPTGSNLLQATVQRTWDERLHRWLFRQHTGTWVMTQLTEEERGERTTHRIGTVTFDYFIWDEPVVAALEPLVERNVAHVYADLGISAAPEPITITLRPTLTTSDLATKGYYQRGSIPARDQIVLYTSGYAFGSFDAAETWEQSIAKVFTHEYTHRVTDRAVMPLAAIPSWMAEGLAEHVAGNDHLVVPQFRAAALRGDLLSTRELLNPDTVASRGMLYACAQSATSYLIEQGGIEQYWQLARAYQNAAGDSVARMETALHDVLALTSDQFDRQWQSWLIDRAQHGAEQNQ